MSLDTNQQKEIHIEMHKLLEIFRSATNSYKFTFFIALLKHIKQTKDGNIDWHTLARGMILEAWWPSKHFKLSFGSQDIMLETINRSINETQFKLKKNVSSTYIILFPNIIEIDGNKERTKNGILDYVPSRLLSPWFDKKSIGGVEDSGWDKKVAKDSVKMFCTEKPPLYKIEDNGIVVHPNWVEFLTTNYAFILGWANWQWSNWLQGKNPLVPMIGRKMARPKIRVSMKLQRNFWQIYMKNEGVNCIYSGENIKVDYNDFVLDHFIPFNAIAHNLIWNLIPTSAKINRAKWVAVPAEEYIDKLCEEHYKIVSYYLNKKTNRGWIKNICKQYSDFLELDDSQMLNKNLFIEQMRSRIKSQLEKI